ncbi:MAG: hypothetical protein WA828_19595 [Coleofasciculaceae cyanobacterium]
MSRSNEIKNIVLGVLLLLGMHLAFLLLLILLLVIVTNLPAFIGYNWSIIYLIFSIGIAQLIYVIPAIFWLKQRGRFGLMKGVIIGAVITALLNGGCWLFVINQFG